MPLKRLAGHALNILPDRMNLFLRYVSGVGNESLELDDSTIRSLRAATEQPDQTVEYVDTKEVARDLFLMSPEEESRFAAMVDEAKTDARKLENKQLGLPEVTPLDQSLAERLRKSQAARSGDFDSLFPGGLGKEPVQKITMKAGPGVPTSGPVNPYGLTSDKAVTQTLGRFMADVGDDGSVRIKDTYDMVNEAEDPDLVSGSFRPDKALLQVQSIYDPEAKVRLNNLISEEQNTPERMMMRPPADSRNYKQKMHAAGKDSTASPLTRAARAALYLSPFKPKPYDIDIRIP